MPPAAAVHAHYLCKLLQGRFPDTNLIVGLWNATGDLTKARARIGCGPTAHVVGTLAAAQEKIHGTLQPLLLGRELPARTDVGQVALEAVHH